MDILTFFPPWFLSTFPFIFIYTMRWKKSFMAGHKLPPSPPRLPVIGNLHQVFGKGEMHQTLWKLSRKYGPAMLLHFGSQPYLVISSSEMARQVLKTHDSVMCSRPQSKGAKRITFNYMDVAFSPHDDHSKDMRKFMVSEFLGAKRTRLFKNEIENEMEGLIRSLSLPPLSTKVNLDDTLLSIVNNAVCKVALGKSYAHKIFNGRTLKEIADETVVMLSGSFSDYFPTFGWIIDVLLGWNRRLEKCFTDLDGALQMVIDEHLEPDAKTSDDEKDLVDECISQLTCDETKALLM
nr:cytochrome P450 71B37-like [Tanacetum cinerariifolium]